MFLGTVESYAVVDSTQLESTDLTGPILFLVMAIFSFSYVLITRTEVFII